MRNHLAEEVLNTDMLNLMKEYQKSLPHPHSVQATIDVLSHTSKLNEIFHSHIPLTSFQDPRFETRRSVMSHFDLWSHHCQTEKNKLKKPTQLFITNETYKDLEFHINGYIALCTISLPDTPTIPALVNSDVVKNVFCMQRSLYSGANTNPDASQYRHFKLRYLECPSAQKNGLQFSSPLELEM